MKEPILVWGILSDGSHVHRDGTRCKTSHPKPLSFAAKVAIAEGVVILFFVFIGLADLALKANGL